MFLFNENLQIIKKNLCFFLCQVAIEFVTFWDKGFGKFNWIIIKNVFIIIFGVLALVFGSKDAIEGIIEEFFSEKASNPVPFNGTFANQ